MEKTIHQLTNDAIGHLCHELEEINVPRAAITVAKTYMRELSRRLQKNANANANAKGNYDEKEQTGNH